ncbi:MAG: dihydrolipoamide acetyltransferase family protein [Acidimicrobiales bacterium]
MVTSVEVPKLGNTVEDCLLSAWRKHKGDIVAAGDVIAEIETDKTNFDLTAPVDGVLLETFFEEGALVPVFTVICAIGAAGDKVGTGPLASGVGAGGADQAGDGPSAPPVAGEVGPAPGTAALTEAVALTEAGAGNGGPPAGPSGGVRLSPRARRFAREHDLPPSSTEGTGPQGRVLESDLRRLLHTGPRPAVGGPAAERQLAATGGGRASTGTGQAGTGGGQASPGGQATPGGQPGPSGQAALGTPVSSVRRRIAQRLRESLSSTAQYTLDSSANAGGLLAVRKKMKASAATADININDLVVFCTVRALLEAPGINATFVDGVLYRHAAVHIGFACDTDRGLVVPVVRDSQDLSLVGLARRLKELAAQAVAGSIGVDDLNGGTFTISNLGSLGVESFTPVLNPPQVAILGVNAIGLKPVRKADGNIEFIDSIGLSLTLDHQVVDGAPGARFLRALRDKIEDAEALCTI